MIDPTLLLHRRTFPVVREAAETSDEPFWVSTALRSAIQEPTTENRGRPFHFVTPETAADLDLVAQFLEGARIKPYSGHLVADSTIGYESFLGLAGDPFLASVLWDEWSFLLAESWIAARVKQTFTAFQRVGGVAIEGSADAFDALARRTLKHPIPRALTHGERLRAVSKWIAGGGGSFASLLGPLGMALGAGAGIFLLFDP
jgi:hypothetical protein